MEILYRKSILYPRGGTSYGSFAQYKALPIRFMRGKMLDIEHVIQHIFSRRESLLPDPSFWNFELADYFCRYSGDKDIFGNVFIHNASGGDDRVLADCHTGKDRAPCPDPYIVPNNDRPARTRIVVNVQLMIGTVEDAGTRADFDIGSDHYALAGGYADACIDKRIIANFQ